MGYSGLPKKVVKIGQLYILVRWIIVINQLGHPPHGPRANPEHTTFGPFLISILACGESAMENKLDRPQSHEEREVQTLVKRIEKQASQEAAREAETKRTFDDYRKTVDS